MIKSIDIDNFGSYKNFSWSSISERPGHSTKFDKVNILYGRNYSGKTTLSKIFRALEVKSISDSITDPQFEIQTDAASISSANYDTQSLCVRVYNKDFVAENLGFLRDETGVIEPFATLGKDNNECKKQIATLEKELGTEDGGSGLLHDSATLRKRSQDAAVVHREAQATLDGKLRKKANDKVYGIKNKRYGFASYTIKNVKSDLSVVFAAGTAALGVAEERRLTDILGESKRPVLVAHLTFSPAISTLCENAKELLARSVRSKGQIARLLSDPELQDWVRDGLEHHPSDDAECGFCNRALPPGLLAQIKDHFSGDELEKLEGEIDALLVRVETEEAALATFALPESTDFYSSLQVKYREASADADLAIARYEKSLRALKEQLKQRGRRLLDPQALAVTPDAASEVSIALKELQNLINEHAEVSRTLDSSQSDAKVSLRLNDINRFAQDISYDVECTKIKALEAAMESAAKASFELENKVREKRDKILELRKQLRNESLGAERVNAYLASQFGHDHLRLHALPGDDQEPVTFRIQRGSQIAHNLSEGECSLVAFAYFLARLESVETQDKDVIVYIDDPISSLDSNHIFYTYSLISSVIAKNIAYSGNPGKFRQLFVSTHNLEFLRYLKRLPSPSRGKRSFMIVNRDGRSSIERMPKHLEIYATEINMLFTDIYRCARQENIDRDHYSFRTFGNSLRKFLEAYLYFKYPEPIHGDNTLAGTLKEFLGDGSVANQILMRVSNELSHLPALDRALDPADYSEIPKIASFLLQRLEKEDKKQFDCFVRATKKDLGIE